MLKNSALCLGLLVVSGCGLVGEKDKASLANDCSEGINETYLTATLVTPADGYVREGLDLCANEEDWYSVQVDPGQFLYFEIGFDPSVDLMLTVYDGTNAKKMAESDAALPYERLAVLGPDGDAPALYVLNVRGYQNSTGEYSLSLRSFDYADGKDCTGDDCYRIMQFPAPRTEEHYRFDSYAEFQNARRELIMLVRFAIAKTWERYPDLTPLGLIDMSERDGSTPGTAYDDLRHPEGTHIEGNDMDIAYFQFSPDNHARPVCVNDGYFCTSDTNTMNAEVEAYFMAQLFSTTRVRVIGVDTSLEDDLLAAAEALKVSGAISNAQRMSFDSMLASGDGWPFHHHHLHLSLDWTEGYESRMGGAEVDPYLMP